MLAQVILWCWAAAALLLGLLGANQLRHTGQGFARRAFVAALLATALWALATAGIGGGELVTRVAEGVRTLAWLGFMATLARATGARATGARAIGARAIGARAAGPARRGTVAVGAVYGVVAMVVVAGVALAVTSAMLSHPAARPVVAEGRLILAMMAAVSALVLTHHLHVAMTGGDSRGAGGLRLVIGALAAMWLSDLAVASIAYVMGGWSAQLTAARGVTTLLLGPALAVAAHRDGEWTLQLSRTVAVQSLRAVAVAGYGAAMLLGTAMIGQWAGMHARLWETAFVVGTGAAMMTLLANPWLRAWTRVKVAKHLFRHRYDYRAEWVRFTDTLGRADGEAPLDRRIVQAVADLTASPGGLLLVPDGPETGGGLGVGAGWNWYDAQPGGKGLARHLSMTARIVELDAIRAGVADPADVAAVPGWMLAHEEAWAIVPLMHFGALAGAILLARPPIDRALDWEDLDLLRIAGRQVASYLAEALAQGQLAEARRFDEFSRRFAFIVHDIKNLVSQLSLVARNAERHADNPAFRADMVATLHDSAERMNALLARLSQHHSIDRSGGRAELPRAVDLLALAQRIALRRRAQHLVVTTGEADVLALADETRLEQLVDHLLQNAIEATVGGGAVTLTVARVDGAATIAVVDTGCGMSPGFVRNELFRAFHSSKPGGFGIGAFEARQLAEAMGGSVSVDSREGKGTRFTVRLPTAAMMPAATSALEKAA